MILRKYSAFLFTALITLIISFLSLNPAEAENRLKERIKSMTIEDRNDLLVNAHQKFFQLPYSGEKISNEIMPVVTAKRQNYAPNFPERSEAGDPTENIHKWMIEYPEELAAYITYLNDKFRELEESAR